ncbi:MAG: NUDIX domain-containing protein [Actinomycetota bacterium]|nr:NUDIX domain-containing protein [Actinomycetota bacterium]
MISPYIKRVRAAIGHDLLLIPSVAVLPRDDFGRVLLVRHTDSGAWATIGGSIEPDETPEDAARREAEEEAGVVVELRGLLTVVGGPGYQVVYPNGDETAYVSVVYDAVVRSGAPRPDGDETSEVGWFTVGELPSLRLDELNRLLLGAVFDDEGLGRQR